MLSKMYRQPLTLAGLLFLSLCTSPTCQAADLDEARDLMRRGEYQQVVEMAKSVVQQGTWNQRWPRLLIDAQLTVGNYEDALETYVAALERFSSSLQLRLQGIDVLRYNNLLNEARAEQAQIFELLRSSPSRYSGAENLVTAGRYFASRGEDGRKILELFYDRAVALDPKFVDAHVAIAQLALSKDDYSVAAESLELVARLDPENPDAAYLSAEAWKASDPQRAAEQLEKALSINPNHIPSLLLQADEAVDREFYTQAEEVLDKVEVINPRHPILWAYRSVLAHLRGDTETETAARDKGLEAWPQNPEVDYVIGRELSQKYRFAEGAAAQRRALEMSPSYTQSRFALAQDLLRLGDDETGWELAEWVHRDDGYNVVAYNLMNLRDRLNKFEVLRRGNLLVRMDAKEAAIYGPDVLDLLQAAEKVLTEKYDIVPDGPVVVEIFPNQQDFAIRTFGLPGGAGFLGVCFGRVITANSPASQGDNPSNWKSVLWHEFCHVVTLAKTKNKMPRWLSEGISVHEERLRDATWGQQMTPEFRRMLLDGEVVPISKLSGAFLSPKSPMHVQLAYFQSSLAVEFLVERFGLDTLKRILNDLGAGIPINESLNRYTESLDWLDSEFVQYVTRRAEEFGPNFDWQHEGIPEEQSVAAWSNWLETHPDNYWGLRGLAQAQISGRNFAAAEKTLQSILRLAETDAFSPVVLAELASLYRANNQPSSEVEMLRRYAAVSADGFSSLVRLMELEASDENWPMLASTAQKALDVNPLLEIGHRRLVEAFDHQDSLENARRSLEALAALDPIDPAGVYYQTARAHQKAHDAKRAKAFVLKALEEAPHYREAQELLIELTDSTSQSE